ncbi:hypothetical protein EMEDMD4_580011 [Sinorhizobium medicae]|uniref:Uncharacterized protein n=1 Tax=Sinorhizobium medicae TaxID=110321 RepID=A0A508X4D0_9HYPH|nr:hypothetical protein EMEDMD4_580011 [Sinorhizobium medicae]
MLTQAGFNDKDFMYSYLAVFWFMNFTLNWNRHVSACGGPPVDPGEHDVEKSQIRSATVCNAAGPLR